MDDQIDIADAPSGASGKVAEYLEKSIAESFKRELDQEENVVRSLPFFATSIGILVTFISFARATLPAIAQAFFPVAIYSLLTALIACLAALLFFLYCAVRKRTFDYPMHEAELISYATKLTIYYRAIAPTDRTDADPESDSIAVIEQAVIGDLRKELLDQVATAARVSRTNNWSRLRARARAITALMMALAFALALIVVILVHDAMYGGPNGQNGSTRFEPSDSRGTGSRCRPEAESPPHAGGDQGGMELRGSSSQERDIKRSERDEMSGKPVAPSIPGSSSAGTQTGVGGANGGQAPMKPSAPPMNRVEKSDATGSLKK